MSNAFGTCFEFNIVNLQHALFWNLVFDHVKYVSKDTAVRVQSLHPFLALLVTVHLRSNKITPARCIGIIC